MKSTIAAKRRREGYLFILPGFLYMLIILGYPLVYNIILSFKNVNVKTFASGTSVFVGSRTTLICFIMTLFVSYEEHLCIYDLVSDFPVYDRIYFCVIFLSEIYVVRSDPWHGAGRIYDADVRYGNAWKKYV